MPLSRWVAGLAALMTAMLLQATLVGPLLLPLPASLPLVLVVSVALLSGPSAGISIGFAGGLLVDLASDHTFGLCALTWLVAGTGAGMLGGMVVRADAPPATRSTRLTRSTRSTRSTSSTRSTTRSARTGRSPQRTRRRIPQLRRAQALMVGAVAGVSTAATELIRTVLGNDTDALSTVLARCAPAALLDALLALAVLPLVAVALRSGSLRPPVAAAGRYETHARTR